MSHASDEPAPPFLVVIASQRPPSSPRIVLEPSSTEVTLGRGVDNTIVLDDDAASRLHARLERRADGWWVVDAGSVNGTFVNGERVDAAPLREGDRLHVGQTIFKLVSPEFEEAIVEIFPRVPVDGLTGAWSRHRLVERIDDELRNRGRPGWQLALALFNIDRFKRFNDTHGHLAGDQVLRRLAEFMRQGMRSDEVLARYGGDELAWLLPGSDLEEARARAHAISTEIASLEIPIEGRTIVVTVSAAVVSACEQTRTAAEFTQAVERTLYVMRRSHHE